MMNLLALSLIATSLVVSGLFSPNPENNEQVIVRGGHRAVVVEYADDVGDGNTKVSISPQDGPNKGPIDEHLSRAADSVAGVAQDVKGKAREVLPGRTGLDGVRPRELICDAYGKCKEKISGVWGKAKDKAAEAEEAVEEVADKAKGIASKAGQKVEESADGVRRSANDKVRGAGKAAERVRDIAVEKARETGDAAREKMEKVKGKTGEMVEETEEMIKEKGEKGKKELTDIARRGKEVILDAIWYVCAIGYVVGRETVRSMTSATQLLGFATAYGIAIWVTFIMSHVLAGVLPRQQFGMVQSKMYPVYFKAMVGSIGLALLGHIMGNGGKLLKNKADVLQGYNLMSCLLFVLANLLFLEPRATKVMFNRMKLEKEEGRGRDHVSAATRVTDTVVDTPAGPTPATTATTTATTKTTAEPTTTASAGRPEGNEIKTKLANINDRLKKLNSYSSLLNIMTLMGLTWHLVYLSQRLRATASC